MENTEEKEMFMGPLIEMIDEMSMQENDPELSWALKHLDEKARKENKSFYDVVYEVLDRDFINKKVQEWKKAKLL